MAQLACRQWVLSSGVLCFLCWIVDKHNSTYLELWIKLIQTGSPSSVVEVKLFLCSLWDHWWHRHLYPECSVTVWHPGVGQWRTFVSWRSSRMSPCPRPWTTFCLSRATSSSSSPSGASLVSLLTELKSHKQRFSCFHPASLLPTSGQSHVPQQLHTAVSLFRCVCACTWALWRTCTGSGRWWWRRPLPPPPWRTGFFRPCPTREESANWSHLRHDDNVHTSINTTCSMQDICTSHRTWLYYQISRGRRPWPDSSPCRWVLDRDRSAGRWGGRSSGCRWFLRSPMNEKPLTTGGSLPIYVFTSPCED